MNLYIVEILAFGFYDFIETGKLPDHWYFRELTDAIDDLFYKLVPLWTLAWFGLDIWYATEHLGWELDYDFGSRKRYHFHNQSGWVILPCDYYHPRLFLKSIWGNI